MSIVKCTSKGAIQAVFKLYLCALYIADMIYVYTGTDDQNQDIHLPQRSKLYIYEFAWLHYLHKHSHGLTNSFGSIWLNYNSQSLYTEALRIFAFGKLGYEFRKERDLSLHVLKIQFHAHNFKML